jgi:hypothetical protein
MKAICLLLISLALSACGTVESIVKSSFPYTSTVVIASTAQPGKEYSTISPASSLAQTFSGTGNNAGKIDAVHIISAKLQSTQPCDYNIGDLSSVKLYMTSADGKDEVMVASRKDINPSAGNTLMLDIDNSHFLDELVRDPNVNVRMKYKLRNKAAHDVDLHVVLNITAYPKGDMLALQ